MFVPGMMGKTAYLAYNIIDVEQPLDGCTLVGNGKARDAISGSRAAFDVLMKKIEKAALTEEVLIEVAGYTVADADRFRSEVSKKVSPSRLQAQYVDFVRVRADRAGIDVILGR